jgi:hypothetical protein
VDAMESSVVGERGMIMQKKIAKTKIISIGLVKKE